ncbi:hypothetical protein [Aeromicrobium sp. 179-A 4D2 NHS]|uniref:hypothetical protein n=1 Tax=Aeromicrobium sp. 179-A 4D2 NHS TaxID=3142375 RepID=UPI0039A039C2
MARRSARSRHFAPVAFGAWLVGLMMAGLLAACGGEAEPADAPETYTLETRGEFLATDPGCDELKDWYEKYPADTEVRTAQRYIEKCRDAPAIAMTNPRVFTQVTPTVLELPLPESHPIRKKIRADFATGACDSFEMGMKNPLELVDSLEKRSADAAEIRAVLDDAARECPQYRRDLLLFTVPDVGAGADQLVAFAEAEWPGAIGSEDEHRALAALACGGHLDDGRGRQVLATVIGPGNEDKLVSKAKQLLCP